MSTEDDERIIITFEGVDSRTERGLQQECGKRYPDRVEVVVQRKVLGFGLQDVPWNGLGTVAGILVSTVGVLLQIRSDRRAAAAASEWNTRRFRELLDDELLQIGVVGSREVELRGLASFIEGKSNVCEFLVVDGAGVKWSVLVHRSGRAFSMRVESGSPPGPGA